MKAKIIIALVLVAGVLAATLAVRHSSRQSVSSEPSQPDSFVSSPPEPTQPEAPLPLAAPTVPAPGPQAASERTEAPVLPMSGGPLAPATNKLERLAQTRESFRAIAAGDPSAAMRAARKITDETERETALLTLVTEWTHGELGPTQQRARAIATFGLEAGLGMELAKYPELAVLWANELTSPASGRTALLWNTALASVVSDPAAAFALGDQIPQGDRGKFFDAVYAGWAAKDTDAALRWVDQVPDPAEKEGALAAIRSVAPVGIGASLGVQDGYPVIQQLVPGAPSELSGQLHAGDRIVAVAQGYGSFVDAHSLSLQDVVQMVRGSPGTLLQLQVLAADAPPNSAPRTVPIVRQQIKFKQ